MTTVNSFSENSSTDLDSDPSIDFKNLTRSNGAVQGDIRSAVTGQDLAFPTGAPLGSFLVEATSIQALVERTENAGPPTTGSASATFEVSFEIEPSEIGTLALDFSYALENLGISSTAQLSWSLVGPAGQDLSSFSGSTMVANGDAAVSNAVSQSNSTLSSGNYSFQITAIVPLADVQNTQSAAINVQNFRLEFTSIPEPSTLASLGLGSLLLLGLRSRKSSSLAEG